MAAALGRTIGSNVLSLPDANQERLGPALSIDQVTSRWPAWPSCTLPLMETSDDR